MLSWVEIWLTPCLHSEGSPPQGTRCPWFREARGRNCVLHSNGSLRGKKSRVMLFDEPVQEGEEGARRTWQDRKRPIRKAIQNQERRVARPPTPDSPVPRALVSAWAFHHLWLVRAPGRLRVLHYPGLPLRRRNEDAVREVHYGGTG